MAYKVFSARNNRPEFLYHGLAGSRIVTLDQWLDAEVKWAKEGSNPYYFTAFHVYMSLDVVSKWVHSVRKFDNRFVTKVLIANTRDKPTAGSAVLAERMKLNKSEWEKRIKLRDFV